MIEFWRSLPHPESIHQQHVCLAILEARILTRKALLDNLSTDLSLTRSDMLFSVLGNLYLKPNLALVCYSE